ncbi:Ig-like domain-containing protein, partial [Limnoraphis robusta]|nr:Ig-like domain-containing protein [Limnoraphis robusta]
MTSSTIPTAPAQLALRVSPGDQILSLNQVVLIFPAEPIPNRFETFPGSITNILPASNGLGDTLLGEGGVTLFVPDEPGFEATIQGSSETVIVVRAGGQDQGFLTVLNREPGRLQSRADGSFVFIPDDAGDPEPDPGTDPSPDPGTDPGTDPDPEPRENQPPIANDVFVTTTQGQDTFFDVLFNDTDPDGDTLSVQNFSSTANGALIFNGAGIFTYRPNPDFFGTDRFSYNVTDGTDSDLAQVVISVQPGDLAQIIEGIGQGTTGDDSIIGSSGDDVINGLAGNDTIFGLAGNDLLQGDEGDDLLFGNQGNDTLDGGPGNDTAYGGQDNDLIIGGDGNDLLFGNLGNDTLLGGPGADSMYGGDGNDCIRGGVGNDLIFGDKGNDILWGDDGNDTIYGGEGDDLIFGNDGADLLFGGVGNDTIFGGPGNDTIIGGEGDDQIAGEVGDDLLFGGLGADTLTGGSGSDTFAIAEGSGGGSVEEANVINDFTGGTDKIGLLGNLTFEQLSITQSEENAGNAIIRNGSDGEFLAVLIGVNSNNLTASDFVPVVGLDIGIPTPPTP